MKINKKSFWFVKIVTGTIFFGLLVFLFQPITVLAEEPINSDSQVNLDQLGTEVGMTKQDPRVLVGKIIKVALSVIGVLALCIVLYAGFLYMTSGGDANKVAEAKKWLQNGFIGLLIVFSAYSIVSFIFSAFDANYEPGGGGNYNVAGQLQGQGFSLSGGAFGTVIQSHYPNPEQTEVPRNTMIMVTFKESIDYDSVIDESNRSYCPDYSSLGVNYGGLRAEAFRVFSCADMIAENYPGVELSCYDANITDVTDGRACQNEADCVSGSCNDGFCATGKLVQGCAMLSEDKHTIIFDPYGQNNEHLGSAEEAMPYIVYLTGAIKKNDSEQSVFNNTYQNYRWRFTTGTFLDTTPPKVLSVVPRKQIYPVSNPDGCQCSGENPGCSEVDCEGKVYLNQVIYVNFDEPVIPPLAQEQTCTSADNDNEVQISKADGLVGSCETEQLPGRWSVGLNQYKTVQFVSSTECAGGAINSCGNPAKCLPENSTIIGKIFPAQVLSGSDFGIPGTGVMDLGGNPLDGNENGEVDGQGLRNANLENTEELKDNYFWQFVTGDVLDLQGPHIVGLEPGNATQNIADLNIPLKVNFSEIVDAESVDKEISLFGVGVDEEDFSGWFDSNYGYSLQDGQNIIDMSQSVITHGPFDQWYEGGRSPYYTPMVGSELKDSRLNCYSPTKDAVVGSACNGLIKGFSCCPTGGSFVQTGVSRPNCELPWQE
ncbi:MAG: pilin [Patescibacteria group bacterium]